MHPVLFSIFGIKIPTYGVLVAVGFALGVWVAVRQARRENVPPELVLDLAFWVLVSALVGSRLLYILVNLGHYIQEPLDLLKVWKGGLVFYGGFLGAVAASWVFCLKNHLSFWQIADLSIPSLALGHFWGRLGCYSAGCCHGRPTGLEHFGAIFTEHHTVVARSGLLGQPLHPTQLYEALGELMLFLLLALWRPRRRRQGELLVLWLMAYAALRFGVEMFRGDMERGMLMWINLFGDEWPELLSTSQLVALIMLVGGVAIWMKIPHLKKEKEAEKISSGI